MFIWLEWEWGHIDLKKMSFYFIFDFIVRLFQRIWENKQTENDHEKMRFCLISQKNIWKLMLSSSFDIKMTF